MQRTLFDQIGGFNGSMRIMEDYDIVTRAKSTGARYKIFSSAALVSARKYDTNSWIRVQTANYTIIRMYKKGASQNEMVHRYKELLNYR
jgi:GT2 family glycosyltransferase